MTARIDVVNTLEFGFAHTGDGYKSKHQRKYNNHVLLTVTSPVYLRIQDVTGPPAEGQSTCDEFHEVPMPRITEGWATVPVTGRRHAQHLE